MRYARRGALEPCSKLRANQSGAIGRVWRGRGPNRRRCDMSKRRLQHRPGSRNLRIFYAHGRHSAPGSTGSTSISFRIPWQVACQQQPASLVVSVVDRLATEPRGLHMACCTARPAAASTMEFSTHCARSSQTRAEAARIRGAVPASEAGPRAAPLRGLWWAIRRGAGPRRGGDDVCRV